MTYVVLLGDQVVAGPFATAAEAVKAREALIKAKFRHINGSRRPILRVSRVLFLWSASVINFITPRSYDCSNHFAVGPQKRTSEQLR